MLPTVYGSSVLKWSLGPKKILDRKFLGGRKKFGQKDFGSKKFYGRKFLWVWKFFLKVEKMYQVKKDSGQKKFSCQKNSLGRKNFSGQKNFQVKKIFRSKKISWLEIFWGWVVIIRVKANSVQSIENWIGLTGTELGNKTSWKDIVRVYLQCYDMDYVQHCVVYCPPLCGKWPNFLSDEGFPKMIGLLSKHFSDK